MVLVRAKLCDGRGSGRTSMSLIMENGEIHHFFALHDGVHHSTTGRFRGRFDDAVAYELRRPNAEVVNHELVGLWLLEGPAESEAPALAS